MAKFTIEINTDGHAFEDAPELEIAYIVRGVCHDLDQGLFGGHKRLHDVNGNYVGDARIEG